MMKLTLGAICCAALMAIGADARAETATFEDAEIGLVGNDSVTSSGGLIFIQRGDFGGVVDEATFEIFANAPEGNASNYYSAFNDSSVTMRMADRYSFLLRGLSYAFLSPVFGVYDEGDEPGALVISAQSVTGAVFASTFSFGQADADGAFSFMNLSSAMLGLMSSSYVTSVTFTACTFDGPNCVAPAFNLNQFAIDNVTAVPEPAPLALALVGLGVVAAAVRRRQAV